MAINPADTVRLVKANRQRNKHLLQRAAEFRQRASDDSAALHKARLALYDEALVPICDAFQRLEHGDHAEFAAIRQPSAGDNVAVGLRQPRKVPVKAAASVLAGGALLVLGPRAVGHVSGAGTYHAVRTFASASTGRAIRTLSGAAARSATLARLGRAAGGDGVAAGEKVLSEIRVISANFAQQAILKSQLEAFQEGRRERARDLDRCEKGMHQAQEALHERSKDMQQVLQDLRSALVRRLPSFTVLVEVHEKSALAGSRRADVDAIADLVRLAATVMNCPITDAEGRITPDSGRAVSDAQARLRAMEAEW
ncbi:hypothetical protein ACWGK1_01600 [Streptomyces wedmorensis]